jgi:nucleotide-binding universal stress UspA family protein
MNHFSAAQDFRRLRRKAVLEELLGKLRGTQSELVPYEEVRRRLRTSSEISRKRQEIPLDRIVGSVGRYRDFTRSFLPKSDSDEARWSRVRMAMESPQGVPPIEVYELGSVYFVKDGNHRVSIAKQMGLPTIEAYVTKIRSNLALEPSDSPRDIVLKAEHAAFMAETHLDKSRPDDGLRLSEIGQYDKLLEHIEVHRYFMGLEQQREIPFEEAAAHWYDTVYLPVARLIRELGILRDFPNRNEADLYLWLAEHRALLEQELGWPVKPEAALLDLARRDIPPTPTEQTLFDDILVALPENESGWFGLDFALEVARRERARLYGLHVVPSERERGEGERLRERFATRCREAGVEGALAVAVGEVAATILTRSRWVDLIALSLSHPPSEQPLARLSNGLSTILKRSSRPVLAVPPGAHLTSRVLLAFDGSPKACEALSVAAYLMGAWGLLLEVLTVGSSAKPLEQAAHYLETRGLSATLHHERGSVAERIVARVSDSDVGLVVMGGYSRKNLLEMALGSSVDGVLRARCCAVLVCI